MLYLCPLKPSNRFLYMRNYFLLTFLLGFCLVSPAQKMVISGVIVDRETKEPLTYASIGIKGKSIGTISNQLGEFDFYLASEHRNNFLVINMLGYKTFEAPVWSV